MLLHGVALAGYRSFGGDLQRFAPLSKVNLLAGRNNSGKSNVLLFLANHYRNSVLSARGQDKAFRIEGLDRPVGSTSGKITIGYPIHRTETLPALLARIGDKIDTPGKKRFEELLFRPPFLDEYGLAWIVCEAPFGSRPALAAKFVDDVASAQQGQRQEWYSLWTRIASSTGGEFRSHWIPQTLQQALPTNLDPPPIVLIPAIRRIGEPGSEPGPDFSGTGIINRLALLQNPPHDQQELKGRFNEISMFLQEVTGIAGATLEIPYARDTILVHAEGRTLPLLNLGTGIHEVVILAAAATVLNNTLICIEEPELHLHPTLQRKLLAYLKDKTTNQYVISTHSAISLDLPEVAIFHVRLQGGQSVIAPAVSPHQLFQVAHDLGYAASDLMQANSIIWVEGPSDRVYLNRWIRSYDPSLTEGVHYSIMFYGGRLLRHLAANDPEIDEFISLPRINRNMAIVIDSDRKSPKNAIGESKECVRGEIEACSGFAWVTAGRQIENYLPRDSIRAATAAIHPTAQLSSATTRYSDPIRLVSPAGKVFPNPDKVKLARHASQAPIDWSILDLKQQVSRLVEFVRAANDLSTADSPPA